MNSYISCGKNHTTRYDWENLSKTEISRKEKMSVPTNLKHASIMDIQFGVDINWSENALLLLGIVKQSFQFEPLVFSSTGLVNNSN